jgi:alkanesulfonate monooxygenase SsuD/methylene tetrahydromethanopterin reductase-like flavin-dependent oxidoreductase (luciferase family)
VKVGLILPLFSGDPERVLSIARHAEDLGFDGVFAFDHLFPPGAAPDRPSLEAFTMLAAVGAATSRVAVGTLVTRAQLRPAGLLAKTAAQLDAMTGGRMTLGIGTGDPIDDPEHRAFGIRSLDKQDRRAHLRETIAALKALFRGEAWGGGAFVPPVAGPLLSSGPRSEGPPVWVGGLSDEVVRIAGTMADAWSGWGLEPAAFAAKASILGLSAREAGREAEATWAGIALVGRDDSEVRALLEARRARGRPESGIFVGTAGEFSRLVRELDAAGATWVIVVPAGPPDRVDVLAETLLEPSKRA